jgi:acyl carrier protein
MEEDGRMQNMMEIFKKIKQIVADLLDLEEDAIGMESYLIRDLGAESIDLLELAVSLNAAFQTEIRDDDIFLRKLRFYIDEAKTSSRDQHAFLAEKYPFLEASRIREILNDLNGGAVLRVSDLVRYIAHHQQHA